MNNAPYERIAVEMLEGGRVLSIALAAPKGNVLSMAMMRELRDALDTRRDDPGLRLVVISARGKHFSFGASVEEHQRDQAPAMLETFHRFLRELAAYPVPVASLVQGRCLGGAFEMVLAGHFVFATPTARFGCPEIGLGVFPPVLAAIGAIRLGVATAERLLLTGADIAPEGQAFVTVVVSSEDPFAELLEWYRANLAGKSAFALRQGVKVARRAGGLLDALEAPLAAAERQYVDEVLPSHDGDEGIRAFLERRTPTWTDA